MKTGYPPFTEFCKFIKREAGISCNPVTSLQVLKAGETNKSNSRRTNFNPRKKGNFDARTLATSSSEERENAVEKTSSSNTKRVIFPFCKENHKLDLWVKFPNMPLSERRTFARANALRWGCLKWAICLKNAEEGRRAISVTTNIPPHYMMMQLLNRTRKRSLKFRKKVKQIAGIRLLLASKYRVGTAALNPCCTLLLYQYGCTMRTTWTRRSWFMLC